MENNIQKINELFARDELENIIEILSVHINEKGGEMYHNLLLLKGRLYRLKSDRDILSYEDFKVERRRLAISLKTYFEEVKCVIIDTTNTSETKEYKEQYYSQNIVSKIDNEPIIDFGFWFLYIKTYKLAALSLLLLLILGIIILLNKKLFFQYF